MEDAKEALGQLHGGRVLDVATGSGGFIHFLLAGLSDYDEIIGIDSSERGAAAFAEAFKEKANIRFVQMDALQMDFPAESFNTVCLANSLHHFDDPRAVLGEMRRVLRPGGNLILAEMYRDGQSETQMTHVHLHHWWAAIDRAGGVVHHETLPRGEIVALMDELGWEKVAIYDLSDTSQDARDAEALTALDAIIDRYIQRAEGHVELQAQGEALRERVHAIGFHGAATLLAVGEKPGDISRG